MLRITKQLKINVVKYTAITILLAGLPVHMAQAADAPRIAVVDVQQVVKNANAAKTALDEIQKKRDAYQSQIDKQEESLKKQDADLSKQKSILSAEAFESKRQEFKKQVMTVQKDVQAKRQELDKAYTKVLSEIQSNVLQIIADLAKQKGFDLAVPTSQVLYAEKSMDISSEVLAQLNKKLPKVSLEDKIEKKK